MRDFLKHLTLALLVLTVFSTSARAQIFCDDHNLVALIFDNGEINLAVEANTEYSANLYLLNPTVECLRGFELSYEIVGEAQVLYTEFPAGAINIGTDQDFIVGFGVPQVPMDNRILLCRMTFLNSGTEPVDIHLGFTDPASIEGEMAVLDCGENLHVVEPISGDFALPVARVNGLEPLVYCEGEGIDGITVGISCQGDEVNLAGSSHWATDGYDEGLDLLDLDPEPVVFFPHPEWESPHGDNFRQDIISYYYPTTETRTWEFVVNATIPEGQTPPYEVALDFDPSFAGNEFIILTLVDHSTLEVLILEEPYQYTYEILTDDYRNFSLLVGHESIVPPDTDLSVLVGAIGPNRSDLGNLAATAIWATDGYDEGIDLPEPGPPPSQYLTVSFTQGGWPFGPRFRHMVHGLFDPMLGTQTWPLRVETDLVGTITLNFEPDFGSEDGIPLLLKDQVTGEIFDLMPNLNFAYENENPSVRDFLLIVGNLGTPDLNPPYRFIDSGWSLIAPPLTASPGHNSLQEAVLSSYSGNSYIYRYLGEEGYELEEPYEQSVLGRGYWLGVDNSYTWTMVGDVATEAVTIALHPGWNLVGSPLWFPGLIEHIQVNHADKTYPWAQAVENGLVLSTVLKYDTENDQYASTNLVDPWQGYWLGSLTEGVSLVFQWENFIEYKEVPAEKETLGWTTDLTAIGPDGTAFHAMVGVHPEATSGFDPTLDVPRPPTAPFEVGYLGLRRPEWNLPCGPTMFHDLVSPADEVINWEAELVVGQSGPVTLQWQRHQWPADLDLEIYLPSENRVILGSMRSQNSVRLDAEQGHLLVHIRTPQLSGVSEMPVMKFSLAVHPNPFNPQTTISFETPRGGEAEVRIFNLRGEMVARIGAGTVGDGRHQVIWQGRDQAGREVPSGSYFARLYLDGAAMGAVAKMSLVR